MGAEFLTVVGLGNPGSRYTGTRHNIGFAVLDALRHARLSADGEGMEQECRPLAKRALAGDLEREGWSERGAHYEASMRVGDWSSALIKPQTFMNRSGEPLSSFLSFKKIPISQVIVVHDEIDIPFGAVRVKVDGGEGGHNGLRSISALCGGRNYVRVRVGVGKPPPESPLMQSEEGIATWVLSRFTQEEQPYAEELVAKACAAVVCIGLHGLKFAQNKFNR